MDAHQLTIYDVLPEVDFFLAHEAVDINGVIYGTLQTIAERFLTTAVKKRIKHFTSAEYTIFTNYLDSHVWFDDPVLEEWFCDWRTRFE